MTAQLPASAESPLEPTSDGDRLAPALTWTTEIELSGGSRIRVLGPGDLPPSDSADLHEPHRAVHDVFSDNASTAGSNAETAGGTTPETVCTIGSEAHLKALAAKVAELDKQLLRYRESSVQPGRSTPRRTKALGPKGNIRRTISIRVLANWEPKPCLSKA